MNCLQLSMNRPFRAIFTPVLHPFFHERPCTFSMNRLVHNIRPTLKKA
jgi:hypothetical protein